MKLLRARLGSRGRTEVYTPAVGTTAYHILAQQIANYFLPRDSRRHGSESYDSELLYREGLARRGFIDSLDLYHARKYASPPQAVGAEP